MSKFKHKNVTNYSDQAERIIKKAQQKQGKGKSSSINPVFNLRASEKEKFAHDGLWFKDYAEYIVPPESTTIEDYAELKSAYEIFNQDLSSIKKQLNNFCSQFGLEELDNMEEEIQPYPVLHNNVQVLTGELLKRNDDFKVILHSLKAMKDKNFKLLEAITASVSEKVAIEIEKHKKQMEGMPPEEMEKYIAELRTQEEPEDLLEKNFSSEWEIFYSQALKYANYDQAIKMKQLETFTDTIIADRCFVYNGWKFGKPYLEVRNVLNSGWHKAPNEPFVHKGDYFWYKKPITIGDAYNAYGQYLSDQDLEDLGISNYGRQSKIDDRHDVRGGKAIPVQDTFDIDLYQALDESGNNNIVDKKIGTHQGKGGTGRNINDNLIWETHIEFKAYRKVTFLTYLDDYNEEVTLMLPDSFEIPEEAEKFKFVNRFGDDSHQYIWVDEISGTEYKAEILYVPRKYEVIRLNDSIYPIYREVPYQNTSIERPYSDFELSTKGAIFTSRNAKSVSLLQRTIPLYLQYLFVKHVQNRELSKYQGTIQSIDVDQIPDELGEDLDGNPIRDKVAAYLMYLKKTNKDLYSGSQSAMGGLPPASRSPGSVGFALGTAVELTNLQNLANLIDVEIGMAMGISPQRKAQFSSNTNVSDNQQAITQSHHITEPYFFLHGEVWRAALNDYLRNFRSWAERFFLDNPEKKEHFLHYAMPDGTEELFRITPKMLEHTDIGLFLSKSGQDAKYHEVMLQLVHSFGQNAGEGVPVVSGLIKGITSGASPAEIHKMIQMEARKQQERVAQMEQQKMESQEKMIMEQIKAREDVQAHEIEKIVIKALEDRKTKMAIEGMKTPDTDEAIDALELIKLRLEKYEAEEAVRVKDKELSQEDRKLSQEDEKIRLLKYQIDKQAEIEKKKIAAAKAKPKSS